MSKLTDGIRSVMTTFLNWLPEGANKRHPNDVGNVAKTSPVLFEYDVFKINWQKVWLLGEIDEMYKRDPRIRRANKVYASTAIRDGFTVRVTSEISGQVAEMAQEIIDEMLRKSQVNAKLNPWSRSLLKDGELFLNPIVDTKNKKIIDIKNLPALTMQRQEDITGRFPEIDKAFRQIDPISREPLNYFPLFSINHIRHDHEPGQLYGNSQYLACLAPWKKLNMVEEDLVVRRRTRAAPKRVHILGNAMNPGNDEEVKRYKAINGLDNPKTAAITTDYFMNGLGDVKDLNADAQLDHIKDVVHLQEIMMIGTGVPLHIIGFGQNVNRDIVEDQKKQFEEDVRELRNLLEYGDESPFSGLRAIFDLALMLQGIDPSLVDYNVIWTESNNETVDQKVDRVVKLRAAQPEPLMSHEHAIQYLGRDLGYESDEDVQNEIEKIKDEAAEAFKTQQEMATALNPEKPTTTPADRTTAQSSGKPTTDSKEPKNMLRSKEVARLEKALQGEVKRHFARVLKRMKEKGVEAHIAKILKHKPMHDSVAKLHVISDDALMLMNPHATCTCSECMTDAQRKVELNALVEQNVIDQFDEAWNYYAAVDTTAPSTTDDELVAYIMWGGKKRKANGVDDEPDKEYKSSSDSFTNSLIQSYGAAGAVAFESVSDAYNGGSPLGVSVSFDFVHSGVYDDLKNAAADRVKGIGETTKDMLRKQLAEAYKNGETVPQWMERIQSVMDIPDWRAEMIARTETAWAFNKANMEAMKMADVKKVKYLAVLDNRTCPVCRDNATANGGIYDIGDAPQPPVHPRCRCQLSMYQF